MGCTSSTSKNRIIEESKASLAPNLSDSNSTGSMGSRNQLTAQFPAPGSQQRLSLGSAGAGRNKVALKPGHSLMDWIRLGRSGKDLTGVGGPKPEVTKEELAKHNTEKDAWLLLRGKVYNITPYLEFHPGGVEELMRGAGRDGTQLFDEIHKWVNAESMLEKCFVGKLKTELPLRKGSLLLNKSNGPLTVSTSGLTPPAPLEPQAPKFDWFQSNASVTIVVYTKWSEMTEECVMIDRPQDEELLITMFIKTFVFKIHIGLENEITSDYSVRVSGEGGKLELVFQKAEVDQQWADLGKRLQQHNTYVKSSQCSETYRDCAVEAVTRVSRDCNLYTLCLPRGTRMCVPVGHHIRIKHIVSGVEVIRSYTEVLPSLHGNSDDTRVREGRAVCLMIKIYSDGALTPWIGSLKPGDQVMLSNYDGDFQLSRLTHSSHLVMFAAGTGFTPMVRLISESFPHEGDSDRQVKLMFFNKTEADILWKEQLDALAEKYDRFSVCHVLSAADDGWAGLRGRVSQDMVKEFLPEPRDNTTLLICACGPVPFTEAVIEYAAELGYKSSSHAFLG